MAKASSYIRVVCFTTFISLPLFSQSNGDTIKWSGSVRSRVEIWDWFKGSADSNYAFSGSTLKLAAGRQTMKIEWRAELEAPVLLGLPTNSIASGAQGQLGLGATYFAATSASRNRSMLFPKQAFIRLKNLDGQGKQSLKIGRFEFSDGAESTPANPTLAAVKRDRIAQKLLGPFGFTHVGRSFDGIQYTYSGAAANFTFIGVAPTRGVFQVDGWGTLPIGVLYGAYTRSVPGKQSAGEFRLFGMYYHDWRTALKTDNRSLAARRADADAVRIASFGGHYLQSFETKAGPADLLFWGVAQGGKWGSLDHRAGAASLEAGIQPQACKKLKPWFRAGIHYGSGDANSADDVHGTFFQVLPTPRIYARFPFYNLMNNREAFAELILRPHPRLTIRGDAHWLRLDQAADLWYQGGGAFQPWTFGYAGRASGGHRGLANVYDAGADWQINTQVSAGVYFAHAHGGPAADSIYLTGTNANFGFVELNYKF
jgi:hypothetical protein